MNLESNKDSSFIPSSNLIPFLLVTTLFFMWGIPNNLNGVELTSSAFDSVIPNFRYILSLAVILFAFSTLISWSYYGLQAFKFLFGNNPAVDLIYKVMFCIFIVIGAPLSLTAVTDFSDGMLLGMCFPNLIGVFLLLPVVKKELAKFYEVAREKE